MALFEKRNDDLPKGLKMTNLNEGVKIPLVIESPTQILAHEVSRTIDGFSLFKLNLILLAKERNIGSTQGSYSNDDEENMVRMLGLIMDAAEKGRTSSLSLKEFLNDHLVDALKTVGPDGAELSEVNQLM